MVSPCSEEGTLQTAARILSPWGGQNREERGAGASQGRGWGRYETGHWLGGQTGAPSWGLGSRFGLAASASSAPMPRVSSAKWLARALQLLAWPLCSQIYQVSPNQPSVSVGGECSEGCSFCGDAASQALLMMSPSQHGSGLSTDLTLKGNDQQGSVFCLPKRCS